METKTIISILLFQEGEKIGTSQNATIDDTFYKDDYFETEIYLEHCCFKSKFIPEQIDVLIHIQTIEVDETLKDIKIISTNENMYKNCLVMPFSHQTINDGIIIEHLKLIRRKYVNSTTSKRNCL